MNQWQARETVNQCQARENMKLLQSAGKSASTKSRIIKVDFLISNQLQRFVYQSLKASQTGTLFQLDIVVAKSRTKRRVNGRKDKFV